MIQLNEVFNSYSLVSKENLENLKTLNSEQDNVLMQLNDIESILDSFLKMNSVNENSKIYELTEAINHQVSEIESTISALDDKMKIIYSNENELKAKMDTVKNSNDSDLITSILNDFYHSIQYLKYYQSKVYLDIQEVDYKIGQLKKIN